MWNQMLSSPWAHSSVTIRRMKMDLTNEARHIWRPKFWMLHAFCFWPKSGRRLTPWLSGLQDMSDQFWRDVLDVLFAPKVPQLHIFLRYSLVLVQPHVFPQIWLQSQITTTRPSTWGAKFRCEGRGHHLFKLWCWWPCCSACQTKQARTRGRQSDANPFVQLLSCSQTLVLHGFARISFTAWWHVKLLLEGGIQSATWLHGQ